VQRHPLVRLRAASLPKTFKPYRYATATTNSPSPQTTNPPPQPSHARQGHQPHHHHRTRPAHPSLPHPQPPPSTGPQPPYQGNGPARSGSGNDTVVNDKTQVTVGGGPNASAYEPHCAGRGAGGLGSPGGHPARGGERCAMSRTEVLGVGWTCAMHQQQTVGVGRGSRRYPSSLVTPARDAEKL
jgi:hypothetical protein